MSQAPAFLELYGIAMEAVLLALILRDLLLRKACRYQDLLDSLTGIAPNTLSDRLKLLEAEGVVERRFYADHPPRAEYVLTQKGRELGPIVKAMRDWGTKHPR